MECILFTNKVTGVVRINSCNGDAEAEAIRLGLDDYLICNVDSIPTDNSYRGAWVLDSLGSIVVDANKAKEIALDRVRANRAEEFKTLDPKLIAENAEGKDVTNLLERRRVLLDSTEPLKALSFSEGDTFTVDDAASALLSLETV